MLKYDYPMYEILGEDAPEGMWEEIGKKFGLQVAYSVGP